VYAQLEKMLPQLCKQPLMLQAVSPQLEGLKKLKLAMPGSYRSSTDFVPIDSFVPQLKVSCFVGVFCWFFIRAHLVIY
jgi:hypothetical protein